MEEKPEEVITLTQFTAVMEKFGADQKAIGEALTHGLKKLDAVFEQVGILTKGQDDLRTGQKALRAGQEALQAGQARLEADVSCLKTDVAVLKMDVTDLKAGQARLEGDVTALKTGQAEIKAELKGKVSVDEFVILRNRVSKLEPKAA